ncbi:MAG: ATP-binding protein [Chloroflexota bacterium]|nr:ATP-binding protein [Chloroflexota bacterium]
MKISLRGRLTLWYVLTVPIVIFGLAFTAQRIMVAGLRSSLDDALERNARAVASAIVRSPPRDEGSYEQAIELVTLQELPTAPLLIRVADPRGNVLFGVGQVPTGVTASLDRRLRAQDIGDGRFDTIRVRGEEALRVYTAPVMDPDTHGVVVLVQTVESLAQVSAAQARLWRYALLEGLAGSVLTLAVGTLILMRGFRPLYRILNRVQEIESTSLREGLADEPRPPELQQLARSLNSMWGRLDVAFKANQAFVAKASHDLRTPLSALQGQIEVLLMQLSLDREARDSLERMAREVRRLVRMTNNLLLNALLEAGPSPVVQPVDLRDLLEEVVTDVWALAEHLEFELDTPEAIVVPGDRDLLKQMVLNLVDNAIKFTTSGGHVELVLMQEGDWAAVVVEDSGCGISQERLARIVSGKSSDDAPLRSTGGGAGLGLSIVRQIVDLHGGRFEFQSQEGVGTTAKILLPRIAGSHFKKAPEPTGSV